MSSLYYFKMLPLCTFILPGYHQAHRIENRPWHGSRWTLLVDTEQLLVRNKETAVNSKEKQCAETRLSTCALQHWFPDRESISITWGMCYTDGCTLNMHLSTLPASNSVNPRWYLKRHGSEHTRVMLMFLGQRPHFENNYTVCTCKKRAC